MSPALLMSERTSDDEVRAYDAECRDEARATAVRFPSGDFELHTRHMQEQPSPELQAEVRAALEEVGHVDGWKDIDGISWNLTPSDDAMDAEIAIAWTTALVLLGALPPTH